VSRPLRCLALLAIPIVLPHTTLAQPGAVPDSLYRAADYAAAAELYREAAAQHPDSGRFWYRLGASLYQVESYDPAIEALGRAVESSRA
jgi:tetratricopeptide (TPR) repeat protein